ncbi:MAG TPA: nickel-binding protein [Candidatus Limnocylindrales bacterium]
MATFIDIHEGFVGATAADFQAAHEQDLAIQADEGVSFDHAWLDPVSGRAFCLVSGPNKAAVLRIHERAGHPASETYELPIAV